MLLTIVFHMKTHIQSQTLTIVCRFSHISRVSYIQSFKYISIPCSVKHCKLVYCMYIYTYSHMSRVSYVHMRFKHISRVSNVVNYSTYTFSHMSRVSYVHARFKHISMQCQMLLTIVHRFIHMSRVSNVIISYIRTYEV